LADLTTQHPITASPDAKHIEPHEAGTDVSRRDFLVIATVPLRPSGLPALPGLSSRR
jgi:hypothetical protein